MASPRNTLFQTSRSSSDWSVEILTADGLWKEMGVPATPVAIESPTRLRRYRWDTMMLGAALSLMVHVALFGWFLHGTSGRPPYQPAPLTEGASASAKDQPAQKVTMLMLLNDHSITTSDSDESFYTPDQAIEETIKTQTDQTLLAATQAPAISMLSGSSDGTDEESQTAEATGNEAGRAMMFGRYMGQIKARIDRAWDYPTTATDQFDCQVQIRQDKQGNVREVTLQQCGDDPAWQLSLVQAIQRASPLSAPPEESLFTEIVTMTFDVGLTPSAQVSPSTFQDDAALAGAGSRSSFAVEP